MILSAQSIRRLSTHQKGTRLADEAPPLVSPFHERTIENGMTFGLGPAGYDVRIKQRVLIRARSFELASIVEHISLPDDITAMVMDKSSWARKGLSLMNTVVEPGWRGFLTIEISNLSLVPLVIPAGAPIAQIMFIRLDEPTQQPYAGKYQDQPDRPVLAIAEKQEKQAYE